MNVVIPYYLPPHGDHELRHALRSIERVVPDPRVVLVGHAPKWLQNVEVVPFEDTQENGRLGNVGRKLQIACGMVDEWLLWNDDFIVTDPTEPLAEPRTWKTLSFIASKLIGGYRRAALATMAELGDVPSFEVHRPTVFLSTELSKVLERGFSQCYRTAYASQIGMRGIECEDQVLRATFKVPSLGWCASTDTMCSSPDFLDWVRREFPEPSRFER